MQKCSFLRNSVTSFVEIGEQRETCSEHIGRLMKLEKLAKEFLMQLYSAPIISARDAEQKPGVTAATINRLIEELEKPDVLQEKTGYSGNLLSALHKYLEIFRQ